MSRSKSSLSILGLAWLVAAAGFELATGSAAAAAEPEPKLRPLPDAVAAALPYTDCVPGGATATDAAIADRVRPQMNGSRLGRSVGAYHVSCARVITDTVRGRGLPPRAAVIAVATAITESTLHNYVEAGDHDSLGLHQQRPSQGWGTPEQITDPVYSTNAFLNAMLRRYPGNAWLSGEIGAICQRVQVSAYPDAYSHEVHDAQLLVDALWVTNDPQRDPLGDGSCAPVDDVGPPGTVRRPDDPSDDLQLVTLC